MGEEPQLRTGLWSPNLWLDKTVRRRLIDKSREVQDKRELLGLVVMYHQGTIDSQGLLVSKCLVMGTGREKKDEPNEAGELVGCSLEKRTNVSSRFAVAEVSEQFSALRVGAEWNKTTGEGSS